MKIACLISGYLRSFSLNIDKLTLLLKQYEVDYYLHLSKESNEDKYINLIENYNEIIEKLNPVQIIIENEKKTKDLRMDRSKKMWYKFKILNDLKNNFSFLNNIDYNIVLRIRPDIFINDDNIKIIEDISDNLIYSKDDEIFYGNTYTINKIAEIYNNIDNLLDNYGIKKENDIFTKYLELNNINSKDINIDYKLILSLCNIIAISGDSGTGKTTLMTNLKKIFNHSIEVEGDRYHKWERGDKNWEVFTHLNPDANYICKFSDDVFNLKIGHNIYQVDYDHSTGKFTDKQEIKSSKNIILCGLHTLYEKSSNNLFNLKIYLDTDYKLKYYWKIKRDMQKRGYSKEKVVENIKKRENDFNKYIEPQQYNSDLIIRFFTSEDFNYLDLDNEPKIFLNLVTKIEVINFLEVLNKFDIKFSYKKLNNLNKLYFYDIQEDFLRIFINYIGEEETKLDIQNNYYVLILAFILYLNKLK